MFDANSQTLPVCVCMANIFSLMMNTAPIPWGSDYKYQIIRLFLFCCYTMTLFLLSRDFSCLLLWTFTMCPCHWSPEAARESFCVLIRFLSPVHIMAWSWASVKEELLLHNNWMCLSWPIIHILYISYIHIVMADNSDHCALCRVYAAHAANSTSGGTVDCLHCCWFHPLSPFCQFPCYQDHQDKLLWAAFTCSQVCVLTNPQSLYLKTTSRHHSAEIMAVLF